MAVSKKTRDIAMKIIIDYYKENRVGFITTKYLAFRGLPKSEGPNHVVEILRSMGYVKYELMSGDVYKIFLTDKGWHYFETQEDENTKTRKNFIHDWIIAIFSAVAGALFSRPLWNLIEVAISVFKSNHSPIN